MHDSPHAARWIAMLDGLGFEIHVFPVRESPPHEKLRNLTLHVPFLARTTAGSRAQELIAHGLRLARLALGNPAKALIRLKRKVFSSIGSTLDLAAINHDFAVRIRSFPVDRIVGRTSATTELVRLGRENESSETTTRLYGPEVLAALIKDLKPDLIHSMEFQHSAYLVLAARDHVGGTFPGWLATNWGSDIFYFGKDPEHARQIRRVCETIDLYSCECHRDIQLGRAFGYRGPDLPVLPNSGGMDIEHIVTLRGTVPPSRRKVIMVKGYDHFAGRAMVSLAVLERFAESLRDYTIILFSVGARPRARALELANAGILNIKVIDSATHEEILGYFAQARMYLAISISDAISTSVLEAMALGAFPIQTNTSCCEEWFIHEKTGFAIPPDDLEVICSRVETALTNDALVDEAAAENFEIIKSRIAIEVLRPRMKDFYEQAFSYLAVRNKSR
jgi:glycosyltransferase involved in cell wall biosynthesis